MFSDAAGTVPIANGATVPSGTKIWVRSTGPSIVVLEATAEATVPSGNVYLYDGNTSGVSDAQHLILAETGTLNTTVEATAEFLPPGSLVVKKTIAGPAAGSQARVVIHTVCDGIALTPDFVIPAGTPAGTTSKTYEPIPAGTKCTVTETSNGSVGGYGGGGDRGRAGGDDPLRRKRDGHDHRYLSLGRLAARAEDDRRSGCGPARGDHDPHGVQWHGPDPGLCDPRRDSRG